MQSAINPNRLIIAQRWVAGLFAGIFLFAAFQAAINVRVGLYKWQASRFIDHWMGASELPPAQESDLVIRALDKALALRFEDVELNEKMGATWEWLAILESDADRATYAIQQSLTYYRRVALQRPTWPYGWVKLVSLNMLAGSFGDEFTQALRYAQRFGPNEEYIQLVVFQAGLGSWPQLDDAGRDAVIANIGLYYERHPADVLSGLSTAQYMSAICSGKSVSAVVLALCQQAKQVADMGSESEK